MKAIHYTNQFKQDAKKHFLELASTNWVEVLSCLIHDLPLDKKYHDHALTGNLSDLRDCHIKPDLVLLYQKDETSITLVRLGTHSELGI